VNAASSKLADHSKKYTPIIASNNEQQRFIESERERERESKRDVERVGLQVSLFRATKNAGPRRRLEKCERTADHRHRVDSVYKHWPNTVAMCSKQVVTCPTCPRGIDRACSDF
jgi:hypothetical protein